MLSEYFTLLSYCRWWFTIQVQNEWLDWKKDHGMVLTKPVITGAHYETEWQCSHATKKKWNRCTEQATMNGRVKWTVPHFMSLFHENGCLFIAILCGEFCTKSVNSIGKNICTLNHANTINENMEVCICLRCFFYFLRMQRDIQK